MYNAWKITIPMKHLAHFFSWNDVIYGLSILVVIFQKYILQLTDMFTCYKYMCSHGCKSCLSLVVWHMFHIGDSLANITIYKLLVSNNMAKLSGQQYSPHISADKCNQGYSPLAWKLPGTVCMSSSCLVYVRATSQENSFLHSMDPQNTSWCSTVLL